MTPYRLVTVAEAKDQLSIIDAYDDKRVRRLCDDASQIVMNYLKTSPALSGWTDTNGQPLVDVSGDPLRTGGQGHLDSNGDFVLDVDSNGDPINDGDSVIPGSVRAATLIVIARLDDDREGEKDPISPAVASLLAQFRDPALA